MMAWMRFTIKELLASFTLIGVGLSALLGIGALLTPEYREQLEPSGLLDHAIYLLWFGAGAAIGAAVGVLFHRIARAILIGCLVQAVIAIVFELSLPSIQS